MTRSLVAFLFVSVLVVPNPDSTRITAAANVTLRALPSAGATAVTQLPLGTELTDAGPAGIDKTWVRVKSTDGKEGWIQASLTKTLDPNWRWPTFDRIIAERLGRKGDGFPAQTELVAFIERWMTRPGFPRRRFALALGAVKLNRRLGLGWWGPFRLARRIFDGMPCVVITLEGAPQRRSGPPPEPDAPRPPG